MNTDKKNANSIIATDERPMDTDKCERNLFPIRVHLIFYPWQYEFVFSASSSVPIGVHRWLILILHNRRQLDFAELHQSALGLQADFAGEIAIVDGPVLEDAVDEEADGAVIDDGQD